MFPLAVMHRGRGEVGEGGGGGGRGGGGGGGGERDVKLSFPNRFKVNLQILQYMQPGII